jgi:hypothetical protein
LLVALEEDSMHSPERSRKNDHPQDAPFRAPSTRSGRAFKLALSCVAMLAGCAGSYTNEPPAATAATEGTGAESSRKPLDPGVHDSDATKFTIAEGPTTTTDTPAPPPQSTAPGSVAPAPIIATPPADNTEQNKPRL